MEKKYSILVHGETREYEIATAVEKEVAVAMMELESRCARGGNCYLTVKDSDGIVVAIKDSKKIS